MYSESADLPVADGDPAFRDISFPTAERARHNLPRAQSNGRPRVRASSDLSRSTPSRPNRPSFRSQSQSRRRSFHLSLVFPFLLARPDINATVIASGNNLKIQFPGGPGFGRVVSS